MGINGMSNARNRMLIITDNTYFLVSLPTLADFAPGDALLYPLADEVRPRAIFKHLNKSRANRQWFGTPSKYF
jgi:hypothetical protein